MDHIGIDPCPDNGKPRDMRTGGARRCSSNVWATRTRWAAIVPGGGACPPGGSVAFLPTCDTVLSVGLDLQRERL